MKSANWYVRREGRTTGPYPAGLISRYVLLGRIRADDEVSADREEWLRVRDVPELIPPVMQEVQAHPEDPEAQAHLESAKRWADERRSPHGHAPDGEERRHAEAVEERSLRESRAARLPGGDTVSAIQYVIILVIVAAVIGLPFLLPEPTTAPVSQCESAPAAGVNWSGCLMPGRELPNVDLSGSDLHSADLSAAVLRAANLANADLSYVTLTHGNLRGANLSGARLMGANLRGVVLSDANLSGADLSYAILDGAQIGGADLTEARLDHARWLDGTVCLAGSVGVCRTEAAAN